MVRYCCRESRRQAHKEQSEEVSAVLIKVSHDEVRGDYREGGRGIERERETGDASAALPHSQCTSIL